MRAPQTSPNSRIPHRGPGVLGELLGGTQFAFVSVSSFVSMVSEAWREWFYRVEVFRDLLKVQVLSREGGMGWH